MASRSTAAAHRLEPSFVAPYWWLAWAYEGLGQDDESLRTCERGLSHVPDDTFLRALSGRFLARLGRRAEAEEVLEQLVGRPRAAATRTARTARGTPLAPFQVAIGPASGIISHIFHPHRRDHACVCVGDVPCMPCDVRVRRTHHRNRVRWPAQVETFTPVTDAVLQNPDPADWLMWRRTLNGWGYSPLDQIDRDNVGDLRLVWTRALSAGSQEGTPLAYDGVLYMPNPNDHLQAIDAVTGDLRWEYRRELPDDAAVVLGGLVTVNRNVAIYGTVIIDTGNDGYVYAVDAVTGDLAWEIEIFDYQVAPVRHTSGPIIANGKVISGRSCRPASGPEGCATASPGSRGRPGCMFWVEAP